MMARMRIFLQATISLLFFLLMIASVGLPRQAMGQEDDDFRLPTLTEENTGALLSNLTSQERAWLKEHPVISVVQDPGWPPVEFTGPDGEPLGMSNDYLDIIEQRLGIKFDRVRNLSWQEAYARLKKWEIDMTTSVTVTPERLEFWSFTKPYMDIPIVLVTRQDVTYIGTMRDLSGKEVAVVDGYAVTDWMPRDYPDIKLVKVKNAKEGLERLKEGEVFAFIDNMLVIGYYLAKLKITDLKIAGETPYSNAQSMAVRKDWPILTGILQKALDSISQDERNQIYYRWVPIRYDYGFDYSLLWRVLGVFVLILAGMFYWIRKLSQEVKSRQKAEASLRKSEHQFRQLFNVAPVPLIFVDQSGVIIGINEQFTRTFGYDHDEIPTLKEWRALAYPEESYRVWAVENWEKALRQADEEKTIVDPMEFRVTCKNKEVRIVSISGTPIGRDYLSVLVDITGSKKAEEALKESEQLFRALVEGAPDAIFVQTNERFAYLNQPAISLLGVDSAHQVIGQPVMYYIDPSSQASVREYLCYFDHAHDRTPIREETILRPDGSTVLVEFSAVQVNFKGEQGALIFVRDITERKNMEHQLQQAHKMEAIGTLTGGIAHDFNNLLQAINGYTQMILMDKEKNDPDYPRLKAVESAGRRAAELVQQLLLFSRKVEAKRKPLDINEEVSQAHWILERTIPKMIRIELNLGGPLWPVFADPIQVEQVLLNLETNAADAMPEGGTLLIETENVVIDQDYAHTHLGAEPGRYVLMSISDSGMGMDKKTLEHIFEPFFTTKETGKGTGLGLASVFGIVQSHGGFILCYSEVGQGTTFKIYFPAMEKPVEEKEKDIVAEPPKGRNETILLVDDEEAIRVFAQQALTKFGYKVFTASNGEEALDVYQKQVREIDLVITDIGMPGMGGHKFLQELLQINPAAKVLMASGYSINGQVKKSLEAGAVGYVGKPYQLSELLGSVREALDKEQEE